MRRDAPGKPFLRSCATQRGSQIEGDFVVFPREAVEARDALSALAADVDDGPGVAERRRSPENSDLATQYAAMSLKAKRSRAAPGMRA
ncbi:hypothetical protein M2322_004803 [Rhodoblastus acidophilus]|nr:hypothetical protein [Rhodoblastus acidophilus]